MPLKSNLNKLFQKTFVSILSFTFWQLYIDMLLNRAGCKYLKKTYSKFWPEGPLFWNIRQSFYFWCQSNVVIKKSLWGCKENKLNTVLCTIILWYCSWVSVSELQVLIQMMFIPYCIGFAIQIQYILLPVKLFDSLSVNLFKFSNYFFCSTSFLSF